jgi:methionyl-tRNA synthetase
MQKVLITSALPYANGILHFGHMAGAYLPADIAARYQRMKGRDVHYVSGSDEYGVAITLSAELAGRTPKEQAELFHKANLDLFLKLNFSFDHYSRTTWEGHQEPVQQFFLELLNNGWIEPKITEQLYSETEMRFLADRYVVGTCPKCGYAEARGDECPSCGSSFDALDLKNPRSKITGSPLVKKETKHWFLLLDKFKPKLQAWLETKKHWKPNVLHFAQEYIEGLKPRSITRDMSWGIPVPLEEAEGKVLYVWFDAPIGYMTASMEWSKKIGRPERWKDYWLDPNVKLIHFIGKDNIPFHAVTFPAMVMGQNLPLKLVDELPANEFLNLEGKKFSKSEGWSIDLSDFLTRYTADQIRYGLAAMAPETADAEFTFKEFQNRCNSELVGKFGNFIHRTLSFLQANFQGVTPPQGNLDEDDKNFISDLKKYFVEAEEAYETFRLRKVVQVLMEISQRANVYFDHKKPWALKKDPSKKEELETTLYLCIQAIQLLAVVASPLIPETSSKIFSFLGIESLKWDDAFAPLHHRPLPSPTTLFRKIEDEEIEKEIQNLHKLSQKHQMQESTQEQTFLPLKPEISIDDVDRLDLRVAQIISAERVPKSKKLLKLQVDLGFEKRQIVAGIGHAIDPDTLPGKRVVIIANLKPATLMGVESQGMILAGGIDTLEIPSLTLLPPGLPVK